MIQANELRIGNWVECDDQYVQVNTLDKEGITADIKPRYHGDWETFRYAGDIDPIELTPEILEKAGFKVIRATENATMYAIGLFTIVSEGSNYKYFTGNGDVFPKYLHQLQNLFFSMTGTELNINL